MSFLTCFWLFPQNEHFSRSPPSPMRATRGPLPLSHRPADRIICVPTVPREGPLRLHYRAVGVARLAQMGGRSGAAGRQDPVDQAVVHGLLGGQDLVALDVDLDLLRGAVRVLG